MLSYKPTCYNLLQLVLELGQLGGQRRQLAVLGRHRALKPGQLSVLARDLGVLGLERGPQPLHLRRVLRVVHIVSVGRRRQRPQEASAVL